MLSEQRLRKVEQYAAALRDEQNRTSGFKAARYAFLLAVRPPTLPALPVPVLQRIFFFVGTPQLCTFAFLQPQTGGYSSGMPHTFDTFGVLFWLGSAGMTKGYTNPHKTGEVDVTMSGKFLHFGEDGEDDPLGVDDADPFGAAERFVMHAHDGRSCNLTNGEPFSWMAVDLGEERTLICDHYCLRHGNDDGNFRLRRWRLEGSNDGEQWVSLKEHRSNEWLADQAFSVGSWPVECNGKAYRHFRVLQTGINSAGRHELCCAGIELYGELRGPRPGFS